MTLGAAPVLAMLAPRGRDRTIILGSLGAILLVETGLLLLFWSITACWVLVGLGSVVAAVTAFPRHRMSAVGASGAAALALGLAFEWAPEDIGIVTYVSAAVPLLIGPPFAVLLASWARWDASPRALLASGVIVASVALIPFTSFFPRFLATYEPVHAPILLAAFGSLGWLVRARSHARLEARTDAAGAMSVGEYVAGPDPSHGAQRALLGTAAALVILAAALALARGPSDAPVAVVVLGLAVAAVFAHERAGSPLAAFAALVAAAGVIAAQGALDAHVRGTAPLMGIVQLAIASLAITAATTGLVPALAAWQDARARTDAANQQERGFAAWSDVQAALPPDAHVRDADAMPDARALAQWAAEAHAAGAPFAVIAVRAPAGEKWWTIPEETYAWLEHENNGPARVHLAILEPDGASVVPPILPEEVEG